MKEFTCNEKARIEYPCTWLYKVFGKDQDILRAAVGSIMPCGEYRLSLSRSSRNSRYHCMNLEITVVSDEDRIAIYEALNAHGDIMLVM